MKRDVLISLKPWYYYLICAGIKKIEVRKNFPNSDKWNNIVHCYMSKDKKSFARIPKELQAEYALHMGKVGIRFVCNDYIVDQTFGHNYVLNSAACMDDAEVAAYFVKEKMYGWHISNLMIYDKPKELCEFAGLRQTKFGLEPVILTRPPQSWCYVSTMYNSRK